MDRMVACRCVVDRQNVKVFRERFNFKGSKKEIAKIAHQFGEKTGVSPSVLDVMFLEGE